MEGLGNMARVTQLIVLQQESNRSWFVSKPTFFIVSARGRLHFSHKVIYFQRHLREEISFCKKTQKGRWGLEKATGGVVLEWESQPDSKWSLRPERGQALGSPGGGRMFSARQHIYNSWCLSGKWTRQGVARGTEHERAKDSYIYEVWNIGQWIGMDVGNRCQPLGSFITAMTDGWHKRQKPSWILNFPALVLKWVFTKLHR